MATDFKQSNGGSFPANAQTAMETAPLAPARTARERRIRAVLGIAALIITGIVLYLIAGRPLIRFAGDTERFRTWVDANGVWGRLAFLGMVVLQIVIAFIPGEPFEIAAGVAFGPVEGTGLCLFGMLIGGTAVFLLVRRFGLRLAALFFPLERIKSVPLLNDPKQLNLTAFALFLIPGTPKDLLTYCAGLTKIRLRTWLLMTSLARFPSVVTSTLGGDAIMEKRYALAAAVFGVTLLLSALGLYIYRRKTKN